MARQWTKALTAVAAVTALAAWAGAQPARAQFSYPSGYDPASGWTWDEDFRFRGGMNPFGERRQPTYSPSYFSGGTYPGAYPYAATASYPYYYGAPAYAPVWSSANYSYGALVRPRDNKAHIRVAVPADAEVWFGNAATQQSGAVRQFESPPLQPGREYTYEVKAQWKENGTEVTRTRHVDVTANGDTSVDFNRPDSGGESR
jgi:uncharacterized protein (TIGR03000 family)